MRKRIDDNQREIVKVLRQYGCSVLILSSIGNGCPDLLIGLHGKNYLIEVKDGSKFASQRRLTELEQKFFDEWLGQVRQISSANEAIGFLADAECGVL